MAETFKVQEIHCQGCARRIVEAVQTAQPGTVVAVDVEAGSVTVEPGGDRTVIAHAIEEAGYKVMEAA